jgi:hypothetical protein
MADGFLVYDARQHRGVRKITAEILLKDPLVEKIAPKLGRAKVTVHKEACIGPCGNTIWCNAASTHPSD